MEKVFVEEQEVKIPSVFIVIDDGMDVTVPSQGYIEGHLRQEQLHKTPSKQGHKQIRKEEAGGGCGGREWRGEE